MQVDNGTVNNNPINNTTAPKMLSNIRDNTNSKINPKFLSTILALFSTAPQGPRFSNNNNGVLNTNKDPANNVNSNNTKIIVNIKPPEKKEAILFKLKELSPPKTNNSTPSGTQTSINKPIMIK